MNVRASFKAVVILEMDEYQTTVDEAARILNEKGIKTTISFVDLYQPIILDFSKDEENGRP